LHIVEKKEELDYDLFFEEGIPKGINDEEWRQLIGNRTWKLFHGVINNYPCETCKEGGQVLVSGIHDVVNISLGKGVFDRPKWREFLRYVEGAKAKDHEGGHPNQSRLKHMIAEIPVSARHRTSDA